MSNQVIYSAEGKLNTKLRRQAEIKKRPKASTIEYSKYRSNTTKEELCHEYVTTLASQYMQLYPKRKAPYMIADNEYGVKKFLPTALKPTQIPFQELYDIHECATFLAGYIQYEPLDPPHLPPHAVFSPTETLSSHIGDSFDIAHLIASFLLGDGYDAYIVHGYAPRHIALKDQSKTICPMISGPKEIPKVMFMISDDNQESESPQAQLSNDSNYHVIDNSVKNSEYLKKLHEAEVLAAQDTFCLWIQDTLESSNKSKPESISGNNQGEDNDSENEKYVHAWIMILPTRREVKETMFIEPSTGRIYGLSNCPYEGIEAVYNNINFWMNLKLEKPISEMDFDFVNSHIWENVFIDANIVRTREIQTHEPTHTVHGSMHRNQDPNIYQSGTAAITISRAFDCPPSYVNPVILSRNDYMIRYPPNGKRCVKYYCSKVDYFSRGNNPQSMMMRVTSYLDELCTIVTEIHEWFENRKDKLYKRSRFFLKDRHTIEYYHPGSIGEIKQWTEYPGKRIIIDYFVDGNLEKIKRRDEIIGEKIVEYFEGRTDYLTRRIVTYTIDKNIVGIRTFPLPGNGQSNELYITSMQQIYDNDPSMKPGTSVFHRQFFIPEGKLIVKYHFNTGSITNETKTYYHTRVGLSNTPAVSYTNEISQEIGLDDNVERLQEASLLERECYTSIRSAVQVLVDTMHKRLANEVHVIHERTVYEQAVDKANDSGNNLNVQISANNQASSNINAAKSTDYLTPYMRNIKDVNALTREEALEIRQNCLDALKLRLIERANIIQSRLNEENIKLGRKQEQFQRSQREGDFSTEEYEKYCTEAMFRIQILEKRLVDHDLASVEKFKQLDSKLSADPRLKVLKM